MNCQCKMLCYNFHMLQLFGYLSGFFITISYLPYIIDILKLKTKPQRTSFFIWSLLGSIAFFSQLAKGASNSLWLPATDTTLTIVIFLLSIKHGKGGFSRRDHLALAVTGLGLLLWYLTNEAAIALYSVIMIDASATYLTVHKAYHEPETETIIAWTLASLGGLFAVFAVGSFDIILLSYPVYICLANAAVVVAILLGRKE